MNQARTSTEHVLIQLVNLGFTLYDTPVFCWVAPEGTPYPFVTVTPVSSGASDYTIGEPSGGTRLDNVTFQLAGYASSAGACWQLEQIIHLLGENLQKYDVEDDFKVLGSWKVSQRGPYPFQLQGAFENDWAISVDYRVLVGASAEPPGQGEYFSSSSSESSDSSESSSSYSLNSQSSNSSASSVSSDDSASSQTPVPPMGGYQAVPLGGPSRGMRSMRAEYGSNIVGNFSENGTYKSKPCYEHEGGDAWMWYNTTDYPNMGNIWVISPTLGVTDQQNGPFYVAAQQKDDPVGGWTDPVSPPDHAVWQEEIWTYALGTETVLMLTDGDAAGYLSGPYALQSESVNGQKHYATGPMGNGVGPYSLWYSNELGTYVITLTTDVGSSSLTTYADNQTTGTSVGGTYPAHGDWDGYTATPIGPLGSD